MIRFISNLFARPEPTLSEASAHDAAVIAPLHAAAFRRGWSEQEVEGLLLDRHLIAHRAMLGGSLIGFIMSRLVEHEAEILSVAVTSAKRGRGLARRLLNLHLRIRLYDRAGFHEISRRPNYYPSSGGKGAVALVLRRDLV